MWIITPEKYLTESEVLKLKKTSSDLAILAKSKGNQIAVRNNWPSHKKVESKFSNI